jgi:DNA polymerase-3 subunit delta
LSGPLELIAGGRDFDGYLAEAALERVLQQAIGGDRQEALQAFRGEESSWAQVLDAARTRSLFASRKALVVRQADALRGDDDGVMAYLEDPTPGVTLVLVAAKPDKRKTLWKRLFEAASVTLAEPLKGARLKGYVRDELRRRKLVLSDDALSALIDSVGADLRRLMGEIDKLQAYAEGERLSVEEVVEVLGRGFARPLYELSDAFGERRARDTLELLEKSLDEGEAPLRILSALHRGLRELRKVRGLAERRTPREKMVAALGLGNRAFKLDSMLAAARRWDERAFRKATAALERADRAIKSSGDARIALAAALAEACGEARPSPPPAGGR